MKKKKQRYLSAKKIVKENSNYPLDDNGVSLPWRIHLSNTPFIRLDHRVKAFCHRANRDEILLLNDSGNILRYYSSVNAIQKTALLFEETVCAFESIGETLVVQFEEHIEGHFIPNGQKIWSREISTDTLLRRYNEESVLLYDKGNGEVTLLNNGGAETGEDQPPKHQLGALDIACFNTSIVSVMKKKDENKLSIQKDNKSYKIELSVNMDGELISIELLDKNRLTLLLCKENNYKVLTYQLDNDEWSIQDSLFFTIIGSDFTSLRRDYEGKIWYKNSQGQIAFFTQNHEYTPQTEPLYLMIDSLDYNNRWHKVLIDHKTPDETDIRIEVTADNDRDYLPTDESYLSLKNLSKDTLLPELKGQYLFMKIYLIADQTRQHSPTISSIGLIYPRSTYLEYLPTCYQEDEKSAIILEHFFSIFETTLSGLETKRANTPSLIDSQETSKENLAWLSSWLGLTYDESWDEKRWRKLMHEAPKLFDIRGTRKGIERVIEIYSDRIPLIQEPMHRRCQKAEPKEIDNFSFCVFLKPEQYNTIEEVKTIRRIVEEWKPAYTKANVVPLENRIILGSYIFLGINTKLEKRSVHLGEVRIPFDGLAPAAEGDSRRLGQVGIGSDAILQ